METRLRSLFETLLRSLLYWIVLLQVAEGAVGYALLAVPSLPAPRYTSATAPWCVDFPSQTENPPCWVCCGWVLPSCESLISA